MIMPKRFRIEVTIEETDTSLVSSMKHLISEVNTSFGKYGIKEITVKELP
jgi:hypothetical protein